jgi:hypothetical protein
MKNEMGGTCSSVQIGEIKNANKILVGKPERKKPLGDENKGR